jgi:hypothetical protein
MNMELVSIEMEESWMVEIENRISNNKKNILFELDTFISSGRWDINNTKYEKIFRVTVIKINQFKRTFFCDLSFMW